MHPRGQEVLGYYSSKPTRFVVFLGLAVVAWEIAPVYASALRFHLALSEACRTAATGRHRPEQVRSDILCKARQFGLPIRPHQVEVRVQPRQVSALVAYEVPVTLGPRQMVLNFRAAAQERPLIRIVDGAEHFQRLQQ